MARDEHAEATPSPAASGHRRRARITDVATLAGVSIKTVSRVVNDEPGVLPDTRERVISAVRELAFVPDAGARLLKKGDHDAIGIVLDAISDPFFASLVSVLEELALEQGLSVLFASTGYDGAREREQVARLAGHRLRGLVVAPVAMSTPEFEALRRRVPVVCVDRAREGIDSVVVDDFGAALEATRSFLARGHRRIGFIGDIDRYPTVATRLAGFRAALDEAGIAWDDSLVLDDEGTRENAEAVTRAFLERADAPTAVFCATSRSAIAAVRVIRDAGLETPALISFGDFELASALTPGITCVDHDPKLIGAATFHRLMELTADHHAEAQRIVVPTRLVPRGSGELPPRAPASATLTGASS